MTAELVLEKYRKQVQVVTTIALVIGGIVTIAGGYTFVKNNFWKPKITVTSVDYANNYAVLNINGQEKYLYDGSTVNAGASYGVRFGKNNGVSNRIELVKNDMVDKFIAVKN